MVRRYAALRFAEDENIADRIYWYACGFPVSAGERVLAPVGPRDRLQRAVVERTLEGTEADAPYDPRLIKQVVAKAGARRLSVGGEDFVELGGVRYDRKHYTRFGCVVAGRRLPSEAGEELSAYGVVRFLDADTAELTELLRELEKEGCTLIYGARAAGAAVCLLHLAGADEDAAVRALRGMAADVSYLGHGGGISAALADMGMEREEIARLKERLH